MAVLYARSEKEMDCSKEVVVWNYFDHQHVVGTHFKWYSRYRIVAEQNEWCLVERFYKLPVIGVSTSSHGFMYLESPGVIRSFQFGKLGLVVDQTITLKDLGPDRCLVTSEYRLEGPVFIKLLEPVWRRMTHQWFLNTWDEDAPMRVRRQKVWNLGFRDFVGIDYINKKTAQPVDVPASRSYPVELPVPKLKTDLENARPFGRSVEVGYPSEPASDNRFGGNGSRLPRV
jgi:hypothetical protein